MVGPSRISTPSSVYLQNDNGVEHVIIQGDYDEIAVIPMVGSSAPGAKAENDSARSDSFTHEKTAVRYAVDVAQSLA